MTINRSGYSGELREEDESEGRKGREKEDEEWMGRWEKRGADNK